MVLCCIDYSPTLPDHRTTPGTPAHQALRHTNCRVLLPLYLANSIRSYSSILA